MFTYEGKPVFQVSSMAWYKDLKRAGIEDSRWHELRHTWASWHVQNGTPHLALQEMAGWETEKMVRRYAHLAVWYLAAYADSVKIHCTILAQLSAPPKRTVALLALETWIQPSIPKPDLHFEINFLASY